MPLVRAPILSGAHRIAGIALFRALLNQCRRQPTAGNALANIVRHRFKKNALVQSPWMLEKSFGAGYQALNILYTAANGDNASQSCLESILAQIPQRMTLAPIHAPIKEPRKRSKSIDTLKTSARLSEQDASFQTIPEGVATAALTEDRPVPPPAVEFTATLSALPISPLAAKHPILLRPYTNISGKRHIPVWTRAHGAYPFLRIKKPQPPALSFAISSRVRRRLKWLNWRFHYKGLMTQLGRDEDEWDELVSEAAEGEGKTIDELEDWLSWSEEPQAFADELTQKLWQQSKDFHELSDAMYEVVQKEKALAKLEKKARKKQRRKMRRVQQEINVAEDAGNNTEGNTIVQSGSVE